MMARTVRKIGSGKCVGVVRVSCSVAKTVPSAASSATVTCGLVQVRVTESASCTCISCGSGAVIGVAHVSEPLWSVTWSLVAEDDCAAAALAREPGKVSAAGDQRKDTFALAPVAY